VRALVRIIAAAIAVAATCVPVSAQLRRIVAELTPIVEKDAVHPGEEVRAALRMTLPDGFHVQSNKPRDPSLIRTSLTFIPPAGVTPIEVVFPAAIDLKVAGIDEPLAVFERTFVIGVRLSVADTATGQLVVPAQLEYQACDDTMCFAPTKAATEWAFSVVARDRQAHARHQDVFAGIAFGRGEAPETPAAAATVATRAPAEIDAARGLDDFVVQGTTGGYQGVSDFLRFIHNAENGIKERGLFEGRGPFAILMLVFLGGLALNLTPCVLPMIPINLAIIGAGTQAGSRGRGFLLGGVYGAAMAVVYGVLGVAVIVTAGTFGTINASPWFNLAIAVLFVALALAMFDVITIDFSKYSGGIRFADSRRGSLALAFAMGAIAALLAGACVAPVVIEVVLFASNLYAKGTAIALALPFLLGVGMAMPWPVAGAGLAALPKPGAWMVRVKQVFGVLILITAAYYGYEAFTLFSNRWVDASAVTSSVSEKIKEGWHSSLAEGLATAKRDRKPVLIDLWATWCKNCLTMDKTTFADAQVRSALDGYVKIKFQSEDPDRQPAKGVMQRFNAVGLPTYVILRPKS
jgi:thioredoxin:protein disulfide reductase